MSKTGLVVFICLIAFALFDLGLVVFGGTGSSVSNFLINVGFKSPIISFTIGACVSHLFFYMTPEEEWKENTPWLRIKRSIFIMLAGIGVYEGLRRLVVYLIDRAV